MGKNPGDSEKEYIENAHIKKTSEHCVLRQLNRLICLDISEIQNVKKQLQDSERFHLLTPFRNAHTR